MMLGGHSFSKKGSLFHESFWKERIETLSENVPCSFLITWSISAVIFSNNNSVVYIVFEIAIFKVFLSKCFLYNEKTIWF